MKVPCPLASFGCTGRPPVSLYPRVCRSCRRGFEGCLSTACETGDPELPEIAFCRPAIMIPTAKWF